MKFLIGEMVVVDNLENTICGELGLVVGDTGIVQENDNAPYVKWDRINKTMAINDDCLKESNMIKQGTRVEWRDGEREIWRDEISGDDTYYVCEMPNIPQKREDHIIIDAAGYVSSVGFVRPLNTKKTKALERIENAEKELKRLKESNMIKLGDRVEVRDNKSCEWSDKYCGDKYYYVADTSNIGGVESEHKHIIIDGAGDIDKYKYCQPINTKKTKALERIENAEKELAEAKKELENE